MEDKPILFTSEMVLAILEDRKTHTRRLLKKQPIDILPMKIPNMWVTLETRDPSHGRVIGCRYGRPGAHLWVRESWGLVSPEMMTSEEWYDMNRPYQLHPDSNEMDGVARAIYKADGDFPNVKWKPSIHMPRWANRIVLKIVKIRVERLQAIDNHEAWKEGIPEFGKWIKNEGCARDEFSRLWDRINGKTFPWSSNPWVWVIEFKRVKP